MILKLARRIYFPLCRAVQQWLDADGLRMSAAMSFYGILSLAPLLVLMVAVLGWWLDRAYIETSLVSQISSVIGAQGAEVVKRLNLNRSLRTCRSTQRSVPRFLRLLAVNLNQLKLTSIFA